MAKGNNMSNIADYTRPILEGHFRIECLDKHSNVIDSFEDHNMIMSSARQTMSEIFSNLAEATYATKFIIGNLGCKDSSLFSAKTSEEGFVKSRTSLFSEYADTLYYSGAIISTLNTGDIIKFNYDNGLTSTFTYLQYTGAATTNYTLPSEPRESDFKTLPRDPYTYTINFKLPGHSMSSSENCVSDEDSSDQVYVQNKDTSVIFTFIVDTNNGNNGQYNVEDYDTPTSVFNEAAIYANGRIFSMKTFPSKTKDLSVKLKVTWTITF